MFGDRDATDPFDPWYTYLSTLELVVFSGMALVAVATLWAGLSTPETDLGAAVGVALLVAGFVAFVARWSVAEERAATLPSVRDE